PDFLRFCLRLPLLVILQMMSAPPGDAPLVREWTDTHFALHTTPIAPQAVRDAHRALTEMKAYVGGLVEGHRSAESPSPLVASLLDASAVDQLSPDELVAMYRIILIGGHETTANMIGNGLASLLAEHEQWERLTREPELVASAVEETLRLESP